LVGGSGGLRSRQRVFHLEDFLGDGHLQLVDLRQVWKAAVFFTVEDFLSVQVDFQASPMVGGELKSYIAGSI
jgi:hypothetical protein